MTREAKPATPDVSRQRLEHLLAMSKRLADTIALDIEALEKGRFDELKTADQEIEVLCAVYGREVKAVKATGVKDAPPELIAELKDSGTRLNGLLARHERLVSCMRKSAEGLVQVVAKEVEKARERNAPYAATPKAQRSAAGAIVYNKVV